jgi:hypothetical protein
MFLELLKNNLKTSLKTTIKQKSEFKHDEFGNFGKFFERITGRLRQNIPF